MLLQVVLSWKVCVPDFSILLMQRWMHLDNIFSHSNFFGTRDGIQASSMISTWSVTELQPLILHKWNTDYFASKILLLHSLY